MLRHKRADYFVESNDGPKPSLGYGHISVKGLSEWIKIIQAQRFEVENIRRGSLIFGGPKYNAHPVLFAVMLILDRIFDYLPFMLNFTENIAFKLRKPQLSKGRTNAQG